MEERPFAAHYDAATHTLALSGVIDETVVDDLRMALHAALRTDQEHALAVDLNDVDFLPSLALGVLEGARRRGQYLRLRAEKGTLAHRVLEITGLLEEPGAHEAAPPRREG